MGSAKRERLRKRRLGIEDEPKKRTEPAGIVRQVLFDPATKDIVAHAFSDPTTKEERRADFMAMSRNERIMAFMMGEHSFCVNCGKDWSLKYDKELGEQVYECECGEIMGLPMSGP